MTITGRRRHQSPVRNESPYMLIVYTVGRRRDGWSFCRRRDIRMNHSDRVNTCIPRAVGGLYERTHQTRSDDDQLWHLPAGARSEPTAPAADGTRRTPWPRTMNRASRVEVRLPALLLDLTMQSRFLPIQSCSPVGARPSAEPRRRMFRRDVVWSGAECSQFCVNH